MKKNKDAPKFEKISLKNTQSNEVNLVSENSELTDKQKLFCVYYSKSFNAAQSYQKAYQCSYENACSNASTLWKNSEVKKEVQRLNTLKCELFGNVEVKMVNDGVDC